MVKSKKASSEVLFLVFVIVVVIVFFLFIGPSTRSSSTRIVSGEFEFLGMMQTDKFTCITKEDFGDKNLMIISTQEEYRSLKERTGCQLPEISFDKEFLLGYMQEQTGCRTGLFIFPKGVTPQLDLVIDVVSLQQGDCQTTNTEMEWMLIQQTGNTPYNRVVVMVS